MVCIIMKALNKTVFVRSDIGAVWVDDPFECAQQQQGEVYRDKEGRRTLSFDAGGRPYFLKLHQGIGWKEILKNLFQGRLPILGARNEWQAIQALRQAGVGTLNIAAYGQRGWNPAKQTSFLVTDTLTETMSLEHLGQQWKAKSPIFTTKRTLINKLADMSRTMHQLGINHRDFYLCHVLLDEQFAVTNHIADDTELFLIDLHRAQMRQRVPKRWLVKDLGSLYFSAMDVPLTQRDLYRFMTRYTGLSLRTIFQSQANFWDCVKARAQRLYDKHHDG
jgi:heptose I phosphotransferase